MNDWYHDIVKVIPGFDLGRCRWMRRFDVWDVAEGRCCRLILDYAGQFDIALVAKGVREISHHGVPIPSVMPYAPYDLGEFLIADQPQLKCMVLFDELKGWRIVADSIAVESIVAHVEAAE